ncbi:hypothetical protein Nepgr_015812 [Nepenthes gracilis]|uniref:Uncharacterized protein n=1 Tax=Nepenthes gracilis TaxID=150966 RepID=A0AAD3SP68_NEPGR|nr:hypothetical protein Nepgr_015812 [Nepenthes gracilis]
MKTPPSLRGLMHSAESAPQAGFSSWKAETSKDEMLEDPPGSGFIPEEGAVFSEILTTGPRQCSSPQEVGSCSDICHPPKSRRSKLDSRLSRTPPG